MFIISRYSAILKIFRTPTPFSTTGSIPRLYHGDYDIISVMSECIFCKIVSKEIPANIFYEDDFSIAMLDINPVNIGHALVVPKEHYENIFDLPKELAAKLSVVSKKLATAIKEGLNADGINITSNNGLAAGQLVFHAHTHIIPRYNGDGFTHWKGERKYNEGEATEVAEKIKLKL